MASKILYTSEGKHHVSLSMPGSESDILKSIGKSGNANFLIPTLDYIIQCAVQGDLGIADNIKIAKSMKNLNMCSSPETLKILTGLLGISVDNPDQYRKNGKYKIPKSAIKLGGGTGSNTSASDGAGLKMIEKTIIKSTLDQYKPFIEIAKILVGHLVQVEDVIARVSALSVKSEKPKGNAGVEGSRPKALGYQGAADMKNALGKMTSLNKKIDAKNDRMSDRLKKSSDLKYDDDYGRLTLNNPKMTPIPIDAKYEYRIISTVYSTGVFKEDVEYQYEYIDIIDDNIDTNLDVDNDGLFDVDDNDPYKGKRPKTIILGIYDSKGNDISPTDLITSFTIDAITGQAVQGMPIDVDINNGVQALQKADWVLRTGRWFGSFSANMSGSGTVLYVWKKGGSYKYQATSPNNYDVDNYDVGWKQQFYVSSNENGIREIGEEPNDSASGDANPPVLYFTKSELDNYTALFEDIIDRKFDKSKDLSAAEKSNYKSKIMSQFDAQLFLENMTQGSFFQDCKTIGLLSSNGSDVSIPGFNYAYRPKKINIGGEDIWIDPEADYDMKIIQIDTSSKIKFKDDTAQGSPQVEAEILRFVKNTIEISMGSQSFDVDIVRRNKPTSNWEPYTIFQTQIPGRYESISQITIDNWQYKDPDNNLLTSNEEKFNNMNVILRVVGDKPTQYWDSKSSDTWNIGSSNYILGKADGGWKLGKYTDTTSASQNVKPWGHKSPVEIDINDPIITKIRVADISSNSYLSENDIITHWYINGVWTSTAPSSWKSSTKIGERSNILKYEIPTGSVSFTGVPNPGQTLNVVGVGYDIYSFCYSDPDATKISRFHFKKSTVSLQRKFEQIAYDQQPSEFSTNGLSIGGTFNLPDGTKAYFNKDTNMLLKWEYLYFDSNDSISSPFMPINIGEKKSWLINYSLIGDYNTQYALTSVSSVIPPNQIRLKENNNPFGRLLDPRKITNSHLAEDNPLSTKYSNGFYGHSSSDKKQKIERLFRYMKSEYDTETYYIVEGILADENDTDPEPGESGSGSGSGSGGGSGYYGKAHSLGAIKVFLSMLSDIFSKLMPAINKLIELFKNPPSFITSIISEKLGESSTIFSPEFLKSYQKMKGISNPIKRKEFAKINLGQYVYVNPVNGDYKVLFDGASIHKLGPLFGKTLTFGVEVKKAVPKLIFSIDLASATSNSLESVLDGTSKSNNLSSVNNSNLNSKSPSSTGVSSNQPTTSIIDGEEVTVSYSTGNYIEGINYQYFYVTEYVSKLIKEGDDLVDSGDPEQVNQAFGKYDEALKQDPNNSLIKDRINDLMVKSPNYMQPIMDLLLAMVCGPLNFVANIVQFIMDFFTNLKFGTLVTDIPKFLSFAWLIKKGEYSWSSQKDDNNKSGGFFSPAEIFKIFGLDVLPIPGIDGSTKIGNKTVTWDDAASLFANFVSGNIPDAPGSKKITNPPGMPVKNGSIDINAALSFSFAPFMKRPTIPNSTFPMGASSLSKEHILTFFKVNPKISYDKFKLTSTPSLIELLAQFICFIESIINAIIDLFWSILGLEVLIPPPHIKICKKFNGESDNDAKTKPAVNYFTGEAIDNDNNGNNGNNGNISSSFIYEVKTSDGKDIKNLNREELDKWLRDNDNYDTDFLFNYTKQ